MDSGILRDVLLAEFREANRESGAKISSYDVKIKQEFEKLFLDTIAWEMDEETAEIGLKPLGKTNLLKCQLSAYI